MTELSLELAKELCALSPVLPNVITHFDESEIPDPIEQSLGLVFYINGEYTGDGDRNKAAQDMVTDLIRLRSVSGGGVTHWEWHKRPFKFLPLGGSTRSRLNRYCINVVYQKNIALESGQDPTDMLTPTIPCVSATKLSNGLEMEHMVVLFSVLRAIKIMTHNKVLTAELLKQVMEGIKQCVLPAFPWYQRYVTFTVSDTGAVELVHVVSRDQLGRVLKLPVDQTIKVGDGLIGEYAKVYDALFPGMLE